MMFFMELVVGLIAIIMAIYFYLTSTHNYWKNMGIPGPKPTAPFGTIGPFIMGRHSLGSYLQMIYNKYKDEPMAGIFKGREPIVVVNDLNIIKDVLIKDFSKFSDRGIEMHEKHQPLSVNLFNLEPKRWRLLRAKLSPIFTSGKLKDMFYLLVECADQMDQHLNKIENDIVDIHEVAARFTTDVIGVCAFGLQANAIQDDTSPFRIVGKRIFNMDLKNIVRFICGNFLPSLYRNFLGYFTRDDILDNFFLDLTKDSMAHRRKSKINRRDFVDLLIALQDQTLNVADDIELTDNLLAAQLFVFFAASSETSSATIGNILYELALNQSIQSKVRKEVCEELKKTNGKYEYEGIKNMRYMEMVFTETLRKYPPVPFLTRRSVAPYTFTGTNVTIPSNTKVWISVFGIQRDPQYYTDPDVFDPERFNEKNKKSRHEMAFLAFGDGPRNCVGSRFGVMQTKVALMKILEHHVVDVCEKTDMGYELDNRGVLLVPKNGIFLRVKKVPA